MPALSPTMTQGNLTSWKKNVGDEIKVGSIIAMIETDKATMDFESQEEGYLAKILVSEGTNDIPINTPIAVIVENKQDVGAMKDFTPDETKPKEKEKNVTDEDEKEKNVTDETKPKERESKESISSTSGQRTGATPIAKKAARERGIELKDINGSGPKGRILLQDVLSTKSASYTDIPLTNMRKTISKRLLESFTTIPHFYLTIEINMDALIAARNSLDKKPSLNDFIIKATALSLRDIPSVNSSWNGTSIRQWKNIDISVAVSTGEGLITPIIFQADEKSVGTIHEEVKQLAEKAKNNTLHPIEFQGGSFTISNLGMYGIHNFTAIINPPQSCILAVGQVEEKYTSLGKFIQIMNVTLSCDHRVVDGALGAKWLQRFKEYMENPIRMVL